MTIRGHVRLGDVTQACKGDGFAAVFFIQDKDHGGLGMGLRQVLVEQAQVVRCQMRALELGLVFFDGQPRALIGDNTVWDVEHALKGLR